MSASSNIPNREPEDVRPGEVWDRYDGDFNCPDFVCYPCHRDRHLTVYMHLDSWLRVDGVIEECVFRCSICGSEAWPVYDYAPSTIKARKLIEAKESLLVGRSQPDASDQPTEAKP